LHKLHNQHHKRKHYQTSTHNAAAHQQLGNRQSAQFSEAQLLPPSAKQIKIQPGTGGQWFSALPTFNRFKLLMPTLSRQVALFSLGLGLGVVMSVGVERVLIENARAQNKPKVPDRIEELMIDGSPALGQPDAPVTVVEFSDFECPYCRRFHNEVLKPLKRDYIEKGLVRFIHKDLPLPFHREADLAARVARCSQAENQYWQTYERLFDRQSCLTCEGAAAVADPSPEGQERLKKCADEASTRTLVNTDRSEAELNGIRATPTFIIGPTISRNRHTGQVHAGAMPWPEFRRLVDQALSQADNSVDTKTETR